MKKKYLILGGIFLLGITVFLLKNNRTIKAEKGSDKMLDRLQCKALTTSGRRCRRKALPGKEFCWQHQN